MIFLSTSTIYTELFRCLNLLLSVRVRHPEKYASIHFSLRRASVFLSRHPTGQCFL